MTIVYTLAENSFVTFASVFCCTKIKTKLFEKNIKKGVDTNIFKWYSNKAVAQIIKSEANRTLTNKQQCNPENSYKKWF